MHRLPPNTVMRLLRQYWLTTLFFSGLVIAVLWGMVPRNGGTWGVYHLTWQVAAVSIGGAYFLTVGVAVISQGLSHRPLVGWQIFQSGRMRQLRTGVLAFLIAIAGVNYYVGCYQPLRYTQETVNSYLTKQTPTQESIFSGTQAAYHRARHVRNLRLQSGATDARHLTYQGQLDDAEQHSVVVTVKRERLDPLGIAVTYSVESIGVG